MAGLAIGADWAGQPPPLHCRLRGSSMALQHCPVGEALLLLSSSLKCLRVLGHEYRQQVPGELQCSCCTADTYFRDCTSRTRGALARLQCKILQYHCQAYRPYA